MSIGGRRQIRLPVTATTRRKETRKMNHTTKRRGVMAGAAALLALSPLALATSANAAEGDISVNYSTQNNASAPLDGSYTVHGRVGQLRDDMQMTYTIEAQGVTYPMPVIEYTGTFVDTADATYTFRFSCLAGSPCEAYQYQVDAMNAVAQNLDGHSIADFTTDVAPIIDTFGGNVPVGVQGTVTVSVLSDVPGTGQLRFWLQDRDTQEHLSVTATTPLSITRPELSGDYSPAELCVAGLQEYVKDGVKYAPTNAGRDQVDLNAVVTDSGILPDDATPVGTAGTFSYALDSGTEGSESDVTAQLLAAPVGAHEVAVGYTAPDGVLAERVFGEITVLGADSPNCWKTSTVTKPSGPGPLANTGSENLGGIALGGGVAALLGGMLLIGARSLRRARAL